MPGSAAVPGKPQGGERGHELGALGSDDQIGRIHIAKTAAGDGAVCCGDDRSVDSAQNAKRFMERRGHLCEQRSELLAGAGEEVFNVPTDGQRRPVAADEHRPD